MGLISILRIHSRQNMQRWKKTSETNLSLETFGCFLFRSKWGLLDSRRSKPRASSKSNNNKHSVKRQQCSKSCVIFTRTVVFQPNGLSESLRACFCSACTGNQQSLFFCVIQGKTESSAGFPHSWPASEKNTYCHHCHHLFFYSCSRKKPSLEEDQ